ncbi:MAG: ABC transporter permease, partial [Gemmatimonadales bacterium]
MKLGLRMLVKHPGMTCVAIFALAIGIPVGLAPGHLVNAIEAPLPVDEGDRIQALRYWNVATNRADQTRLYDLSLWREELTGFDGLGGARSGLYNLNSEGEHGAPTLGAEVTASSFDILRVPPLHGRTLIASDEIIGGPDVVVIGHDLWQSRLAADPDVVGRVIEIGRTPHTVVGVMPENFRFPVRHQLWLPLRERLAEEPGQGLSLTIFGRLSDGVSPQEAQTELTALGRRMASEFPATHERLRPEVVPFAFTFFALSKGFFHASLAMYVVRVFALLLLVVACGNVGILIFARTTTRSAEFAVRTALGASRARIISQGFTESLVLAVSAAGVGLLLIDWLPRLLPARIAASLPYWIDLGVTRGTVVWALSLAVFSAAVAGVVPALKVTGNAVQWNMQRAAAGRSGIRFGGMSSALIVADVAIAVAAVGFAAGMSSYLREAREAQDAVGIQADQYLSVQLTLPTTQQARGEGTFDRSEFRARVAATQRALVRRLEGESGIRGVAVGRALPRMQHPSRQIELDDESLSDDFGAPWVRVASVDVDFFRALEQPVVMGRGFDTNDLVDNRAAVIVNTTFVDRLLGGRDPIGRRLRYKVSGGGEPGPWYEIVGVVGPLGMTLPKPSAVFYHPAAPGEIDPVRLAVHVGDDPESFTPRLRTLVGEVDP